MLQASREDTGRTGRWQGAGMGLLLGAALGAGVALLMAPASGEETRTALKHRARRAARQGQRALDDLLDEAEFVARRYATQGLRRTRDLVGRD